MVIIVALSLLGAPEIWGKLRGIVYPARAMEWGIIHWVIRIIHWIPIHIWFIYMFGVLHWHFWYENDVANG